MGKGSKFGHGHPDGNQKEIVQLLLDTGFVTVENMTGVGHGFPDLLVGFYSIKYDIYVNLLFEVKNKKGKLRKDQELWHNLWKGNVYTIRSFDDAMTIINKYREAHIEEIKSCNDYKVAT